MAFTRRGGLLRVKGVFERDGAIVAAERAAHIRSWRREDLIILSRSN